jgi:hypothetical protein
MGSPSVTHTQAAAHLSPDGDAIAFGVSLRSARANVTLPRVDGFPVKKGETATHNLEETSRLCASRQDRGNPKTALFAIHHSPSTNS